MSTSVVPLAIEQELHDGEIKDQLSDATCNRDISCRRYLMKTSKTNDPAPWSNAREYDFLILGDTPVPWK
jgi:hypothetical protein